MQRMQMLSS